MGWLRCTCLSLPGVPKPNFYTHIPYLSLQCQLCVIFCIFFGRFCLGIFLNPVVCVRSLVIRVRKDIVTSGDVHFIWCCHGNCFHFVSSQEDIVTMCSNVTRKHLSLGGKYTLATGGCSWLQHGCTPQAFPSKDGEAMGALNCGLTILLACINNGQRQRLVTQAHHGGPYLKPQHWDKGRKIRRPAWATE